MANRLDGKITIVTGGGRGIGRGVALRFGAEGARIVVATRSGKPNRETVEAITNAGGEAVLAVTAAYDRSSAGLIVDVGGGTEARLVDTLEKSLTSRDILFYQEHVLVGALQHQRMSMVAGDFFQEVPKEADLYLIRAILHAWDDAKALAVLSTTQGSRLRGEAASCRNHLNCRR